ncbi:MAG: SDR family oxidoreductase, partial [Gammaproteobacteria bacterium]|nr:SDR family oxidoreductase [Gammaproteobacteria bacterium]
PTVLVTGANRGIGLEFVRQYASRGWRVIATCRDPSRAQALEALLQSHAALHVDTLDLASTASITALARRLAGQAIDVLLNNAALLGPGEDQLLGQWRESAFLDAFRANALGPALLTEQLLAQVEAGTHKKVIFLGSAAGAIGLLRPPANLYAYRASKAALHLLVRNLALDLQPRGITVGLVNPGLVDTRGLLDLAPGDPGPADLAHLVSLVRAGHVPMVRPAESVAGMLQLIDAWTPETAGVFLNYDGAPLPW